MSIYLDPFLVLAHHSYVLLDQLLARLRRSFHLFIQKQTILLHQLFHNVSIFYLD